MTVILPQDGQNAAATVSFEQGSAAAPQVRKQTGVGALALRLNHILVEHIRALLPSLKGHLEAAASARSAELRRYGASPPGSTSAARCGAPQAAHLPPGWFRTGSSERALTTLRRESWARLMTMPFPLCAKSGNLVARSENLCAKS